MAKREFNSNHDINTLPIEATPYEAADSSKIGLRLRVPQSAIKTFIWRARIRQRTHIMTIGNPPEMSINDARKRLDKLKQEYKDNVHIVKPTGKTPQTVMELTVEYTTTLGNLSASRQETHASIFSLWINLP